MLPACQVLPPKQEGQDPPCRLRVARRLPPTVSRARAPTGAPTQALGSETVGETPQRSHFLHRAQRTADASPGGHTHTQSAAQSHHAVPRLLPGVLVLPLSNAQHSSVQRDAVVQRATPRPTFLIDSQVSPPPHKRPEAKHPASGDALG